MNSENNDVKLFNVMEDNEGSSYAIYERITRDNAIFTVYCSNPSAVDNLNLNESVTLEFSGCGQKDRFRVFRVY